MDEFCRAHPQLEHLHLRELLLSRNFCRGDQSQHKGDWMLNKLKTLVYNSAYPRKGNELSNFFFVPFIIIFFLEILEKFIRAGPNVESLHIGHSNETAFQTDLIWYRFSIMMESNGNLINMIRLDRLTTLSLNIVDLLSGDSFETVKQFSFSIWPLL